MSLLRRLRRLLRRSSPAEGVSPVVTVPAGLRADVERAIGDDDADALARLLETRRDEGKALIREWSREMEAAADDAVRVDLARRITALVALYDRAFGDREPLGWFQRAGESPSAGLVGLRLLEAQRAFAAGHFERADEEAAAGLTLLETEKTPEAAGLESTLLAVRGAVAVRRERWDDARDLFDRSLEAARAASRPEPLAAALLNRIDLATRRGQLADGEPLVDEACRAGKGTPYEDVLGRTLVERGVALTRSGDLAGAVATLDRAAEVKPDWPFPFYQRAWARFLMGDSGGALDDYRACALRKRVFFTVQREIRCLEDVAAGRLPIEAYRSFCLVRDRVRQDPQQVEEAAVRMAEKHPGFAPAYLLRSEARLVLNDPDAAREAAREALRQDPDPDTAAAALFLDWNVSRLRGETEAAAEAAERLRGAYAEHPAAMIVGKVLEHPEREMALRWTFAMDGSLHFEEMDPSAINPPDRKPPPPGSPG